QNKLTHTPAHRRPAGHHRHHLRKTFPASVSGEPKNASLTPIYLILHPTRDHASYPLLRCHHHVTALLHHLSTTDTNNIAAAVSISQLPLSPFVPSTVTTNTTMAAIVPPHRDHTTPPPSTQPPSSPFFFEFGFMVKQK
nr:hypothetical protein [Tanacetum cinerariifolium]